MKSAAPEAVTRTVRKFYEEFSFPGYEEFESLASLVRKAEEGEYAKLLDQNIPPRKRVLDLGCGTGQLAIFLSLAHRQVVGMDLSLNSLRKANGFRERFDLRRVRFCQGNLFQIPLQSESFDYVFCNGVLHHTGDARRGFEEAVRLLKPGGYFILGLYNTYGRLLLDLRRVIFRFTKNRFRGLDALLRQKGMSPKKKLIWFKDQYEHPHETKHSVDEVLGWFQAVGLEYVNALPPIRAAEVFDPKAPLFGAKDPGNRLDHLLAQLGWIFTKEKEGGFFLLIGQKK